MTSRLRGHYRLLIFLLLGIVTSLFVGRIPSRQYNRDRPQSLFGIAQTRGPTEDVGSAGYDFVFVHGLGSNPDTTWTAKSTNGTIRWIEDYLWEDLSLSVKQSIRIFYYNHDTYWKRDSASARLSSVAEDLLFEVKQHLHRHPAHRDRNLIFIGHSYGGLIIKQALVRARSSQDWSYIPLLTRAILFLGTPHQGSRFSNVGSLVARSLSGIGANAALLETVRYDSLPLLDLHREFLDTLGDGVKIFNFYERRQVELLRAGPWTWRQWCVTEQSATFAFPSTKNIGLSTDHYGLNKFAERNVDYTRVKLALEDVIKLEHSQTMHVFARRPSVNYVDRPDLSRDIEAGGAGKTQLLINYIESHKNRYNPICWIDAQDEERIKATFDQCAVRLGLAVVQSQHSSAELRYHHSITAVHDFLIRRDSNHPEWLVVFDNADNVTTAMKDVVPFGTQGSVIITSRDDTAGHRLVHPRSKTVTVGKMKTSEAEAVLHQHLSTKKDDLSKADALVLSRIAARVDNLPLALGLAGSFIQNTLQRRRCTIADAAKRYTDAFDNHKEQLMRSKEWSGLDDYEKNIWTVWETSITEADRQYPELHVGWVLALLSQFRGDTVPHEMFALAARGLPRLSMPYKLGRFDQWIMQHIDPPCNTPGILPKWLVGLLSVSGEEWDSFNYHAALDQLYRYGLVFASDGDWPGSPMHGLVKWKAQMIFSDQQEELERWYWMVLTAASMAAIDDNGLNKVDYGRVLLPHIPTPTNKQLFDLGFSVRQRLEILFRIEVVLHMYDYRTFDTTNIQRGLAWQDRRRWWPFLDFPLSRFPITGEQIEYEHFGSLARARLLNTEGSARLKGIPDITRLGHASNLISAYINAGRLREAEETAGDVIAEGQRLFGGDSIIVLSARTKLGKVYQSMGMFKAASQLLADALFLQRKALFYGHPIILSTMETMVDNHHLLGRCFEAEELQKEVVAVRQRQSGDFHCRVQLSLAKLGRIQRECGATSASIETLETLVSASQQANGDRNMITLLGKMELEITERALGRFGGEAYHLELFDRYSNRALKYNYLANSAAEVADTTETGHNLLNETFFYDQISGGNETGALERYFSRQAYFSRAAWSHARQSRHGHVVANTHMLYDYLSVKNGANHTTTATVQAALGALQLEVSWTRDRGMSNLTKSLEIQERMVGRVNPKVLDILQKVRCSVADPSEEERESAAQLTKHLDAIIAKHCSKHGSEPDYFSACRNSSTPFAQNEVSQEGGRPSSLDEHISAFVLRGNSIAMFTPKDLLECSSEVEYERLPKLIVEMMFKSSEEYGRLAGEASQSMSAWLSIKLPWDWIVIVAFYTAFGLNLLWTLLRPSQFVRLKFGVMFTMCRSSGHVGLTHADDIR
ncbi:tetratricopeptide repeat-containing protein 12 [Elsinoe australis]|uniref:Tetratricopeptide repeat-containing protein 12 n=1 Tax=Elsinoe australis TaxID=40998 RepID=A0A4V6DTI9_9PEZI|nr:tetratricopeptide repeat-containing protein 12 [Elsinoe australis]